LSTPPISPLLPYTTLFRSLAHFFGLAAVFHRLGKGTGRAAVCPAAKRELFHHTGLADDECENKIPDKEGHAAVLGNQHRETPNVDRKSTRLNSSHVSISYA